LVTKANKFKYLLKGFNGGLKMVKRKSALFVDINRTVDCEANGNTVDLDECEGCHYFKGFNLKDDIYGFIGILCSWRAGDPQPDAVEEE